MEDEKVGTPLSDVGKLIFAIAFADARNFRKYYYNQNEILYLNYPAEGNRFFSENSITKINPLHLAKMSLDLWYGIREQGSSHPNTFMNRYENALWIYYYIANKIGQTNPIDLDYSALAKERLFTEIDWDWDWMHFENEKDEMIKAGIRPIDIELFDAANLRNRALVLDLLDKGANPYVNLYDDDWEYLGTSFSILDYGNVFENHNSFGKWFHQYWSAKPPILSDEEIENRKDPYWGALFEYEKYKHPALDYDLFHEEDVEPLLCSLLVGASAEVFKQLLMDRSKHPKPENPNLPPHEPRWSPPLRDFSKEVEEPEPEPRFKPLTFTFARPLDQMWEEALQKAALEIEAKEKRAKEKQRPGYVPYTQPDLSYNDIIARERKARATRIEKKLLKSRKGQKGNE